MIIHLTHSEAEELISKAIGYRCAITIVTRPAVPGESGYELKEPLRGELLALVREGQAIEAIKRLRFKTGCGLRQAKDEIDRLR